MCQFTVPGSSCWWLFYLNAPVLHRHRAEEANRDKWSRCVISIFSSSAANFLHIANKRLFGADDNPMRSFRRWKWVCGCWEDRQYSKQMAVPQGSNKVLENKFWSLLHLFPCISFIQVCLSGALSSQWNTHSIACFQVHLFSVCDASAVEASITSLRPSLSVYYYSLVGNSSGEGVPLVSSSSHLGCWRASNYAYWVCNGVQIEGR